MTRGSRCTRKTLEQRFWEKVDRDGPPHPYRPELGPCWLWLAATNSRGYGVLRLPGDGGLALAHRVSLRLADLDPGSLLARHSCDNPGCVNPAHLGAGTAGENSADMVGRGRSLRGERQPNAKLTEETVRALRADHAAGDVSIRRLAARYGVAFATAHAAVRGYRWGHVDAEAA